MTKHKFTDGEVIRDLLRCANKDVSFCKECRHRNYGDRCCIQLMTDALDLIKRQKAEIDRLNILVNGAKTKTVGKFVPRDYIQLTIDDMESET